MKNMVKIIVCLVALSINSTVFGAYVTQTVAQTIATSVATKGENHLKSASVLSLVYAKENAFYVFGNESSFVIVAADDRVTPILGYSNEGPFMVPTANDSTGNNFWGMLDAYEQQIEYVVVNNISATNAIAVQWEKLKSGNILKSANVVVTPLLTTKWGQGWPYNALCPNGATAGCVAIAMAQIMKYHNYPDQGLGTYGYQSDNIAYPYTKADFGATTYNWTTMPDSLIVPNNDIATLIYQTAVSVRSDWGPITGAQNLGNELDPMTSAFVNYFKYAFAPIKLVSKKDYTDVEWNSLIQNELINKRPVYYRGNGNSSRGWGSHAWVCDGIDTNNMYHFNWGWSGDFNGYYTMTNLNPNLYDFTDYQQAIIGIMPNDGSTLVENTTWSGNINKNTNIAVPDAVTLTVNPGTIVKFNKDCRLQVFGRLLSNGTSDNYVKFTAVDTSTGWLGIKWDNDYGLPEVTIDNDSSKLVYTQVEYSKEHGIYCRKYGKIVINHCKINNNDAGVWSQNKQYNSAGGGVFMFSSPITISNSEIYNNHANVGAGVFLSHTDDLPAKLYANTIYNNIADIEGGGISLVAVNKVTIKNNIFHTNYAINGAALSTQGGNIHIDANRFYNNTTPGGFEAGVLHFYMGTPILTNNLIANNDAIGISYVTASPIILNNTITNNNSSYGSGIRAVLSPNATIKNCIIYSTQKNTPQIYIADDESNPIFDHCNIQGGINNFGGVGAGNNYNASNYTNNIDSDPLFVTPSIGVGKEYNGSLADWTLKAGSPCINAGDGSGISSSLPTVDLLGNPRINNIVDMGAYEYQLNLLPASLTIIASANPVSKGTMVIYTANPINGGTTPVYQWKKNGNTIGNNTATYSYIPVDGDVISCVVTSSLSNATGNPATSNTITMSVTPLTAVSPMVTLYELSVYPNPCHGVFSIKTSEELSKVILIDQLGKVISETVSPDLGFSYDYSFLPKGVYFVCLVSAKERIVKKIIFN